MPPVRVLRERAVDVAHGSGKVAARRIEQQMVVIAHQTELIDAHPVLLACDCEQAEEVKAVVVVFENRFLTVPARHRVE
jgi:hypothetical protein